MATKKNSILADSINNGNNTNNSDNIKITIEKPKKAKRQPSERQLEHMRKMREAKEKKRQDEDNYQYETKRRKMAEEEKRQQAKDMLIEKLLNENFPDMVEKLNEKTKTKKLIKKSKENDVKIIKRPIEVEAKRDIESDNIDDVENNEKDDIKKEEKPIEVIRKLNRDIKIIDDTPKKDIQTNQVIDIKQINNIEKKQTNNLYLKMLGLMDD